MGTPGILLAYVCGLLLCPLLNVSTGITVLFCLLLLPVWFSVRHRRVAALVVATFFFGAGICHYQLRLDPPHSPDHIVAWASAGEVTVQGRVLDIASKATGNSRVDLRVQAVGTMRSMKEASGKVRLYLAEGPLSFQVGQTVRFRSRLRRPRLFGIPGEFDHPRHLALFDIFVTAFVKQAAEIVPFVPVHGERMGRLQRLRSSASGLIVESIPAKQAPLVAALVLGDKAGIPAEERDLLARGGISHLFSISGFHLGLVASLFYGCALLLYRRFESLLLWQAPRRVLPLLLVPPIYGYVLLTGSSLPTLRAFLFVSAGALLATLSRRTRPLKLLAAAALILLLWQPLALFQPSFQLSFAGVAGILVAWSPFQTMSRAWPRWLRMPAGLFLTTLAATTATAPFVLWHFRMLAPAGLLLNLAVCCSTWRQCRWSVLSPCRQAWPVCSWRLSGRLWPFLASSSAPRCCPGC